LHKKDTKKSCNLHKKNANYTFFHTQPNQNMLFSLKSEVYKSFILFCTISVLASPLIAQNWEMRYLRGLEKNRSKSVDNLMHGLSKTAPPLCVATPASLFLTSLVTKDKQLQRVSITGGIGLVATIGSTYALKHLIKRRRPYDRYPQDLSPLEKETSFSMPSGHTSTAFYNATWLTLAYPKWYVAVPAYLWAGTIGYSRNHLGVHYLTDVLAGAVLGGATAWAVWRFRK
jgi:membrane-associated phospholipid phosphatase